MLERSEKIKLGVGILMISFVAISVLSAEDSNLFQAKLSPDLHNSSQSKCERIIITSQPESPLPPYTSALIRVQTVPISFSGLFTFSADSGVFDDLMGQRDSFIETKEKIVSYSGGEPGTVLTIQDKEGDNFNCYGTLEVSDKVPASCVSIKAKTSPAPLTENQSAEIEISTEPMYFSGSYLIQAESGKLQPASADSKTSGINTNTLVTSSKYIIYSGGKKGEKIHFQALGENNHACQTTINIETAI